MFFRCYDGVRLCVCGTGLLTGPFSIPQMIHEWIWIYGGMILTGENRTLRKTCPSATVSTTNPTQTALGVNPVTLNYLCLHVFIVALSCANTGREQEIGTREKQTGRDGKKSNNIFRGSGLLHASSITSLMNDIFNSTSEQVQRHASSPPLPGGILTTRIFVPLENVS
jgi:hypothetical protein